ncbi:MAG: cysteine desulfurase family protein [Candidatus Nitrosocaldus sp.]|nr:cysteine desulfurase [Candidatus Nitrosocaldus sp.]MCS7141218.1 cysteine desulfurase [Candidatus Nitrosocaldus sp.]MDW8000176.1 cysteine desulfurase family protein [Candidatus Nitrosocaldus sp.]MDW8275630.1 cysteine desulfurase family protein [Candidatus Nitrosocaldus sp.]
MEKRRVYLDNAATTPVLDEVVQEMLPYMNSRYGNPSSLHALGREARAAVDRARERIERAVGMMDGGYSSGSSGSSRALVVFTSGATEANNLALKGFAYAMLRDGKSRDDVMVIASSVEHESVLEPCRALERDGFDVRYLPVDSYGMVRPESLEGELRSAEGKSMLVSVMLANNEVGTIQRLREIAVIAHDHGALVHSDAAQAFGKVPIDARALQVDMLTISAHKVYGPKGIGALCISSSSSRDVRLEPVMHGGGHEYGLRSGTQNVPAIVGFGKVAELVPMLISMYGSKVKRLRDRLMAGILEIPYTRLNGHAEMRLPNNVHVSFLGVNGEDLIMKLDEYGVEASTGSACSTLKQRESHVLRAMGLKREEINGSLRLTLGIQNDEQDIEYALDVMRRVVRELRRISPYSRYRST